MSNAFDQSKYTVVGVLVTLRSSISIIIKSTNLIIANSVECLDLNPYCCSVNKLFTVK